MPVIDQWFTLATAGETIDDRVIEESWLREMAESYSTDYYTAVIDADHALDWFGAFGHVTELRLGEKVGRVALQAKLNANHRLMEMNRNGQRLWFSIEPREVEGKMYLFRLAITDSPASIGTDQMKFSAGPNGEKSTFTAPKPLEFNTDKNPESETQSLLTKILQAVTGVKGDENQFNNQPGETPDDNDEGNDDMKPEQFEQLQKTLEQQGQAQVAAIEALGEKFAVKPDDTTEGDESGDGDNNTDEQETVSAETFNALKTQFDDMSKKFEALQKTPAGGTELDEHQGGAEDELDFV